MFTSGDPLHSPYALQDGVASLMLGFTRDDERLTATGIRHIRRSLGVFFVMNILRNLQPG